ncbi:MAG: lysophospholipid acyltransferase family protein [Burkholderiales bacterium]
MTRFLRACWRLFRVLLHIVQAVLRCAFLFPFLDSSARLQQVQRWCVGLLHCLGITVQTSGHVRSGPVLVVANHVSWLDIMAVIAVHPVRFVSKADVKHWPVLGWIVACGGTLFIEREKKRDALRVVHHIAEALKEGDALAIFPEGTTGDGHALLPFHANLLQAAIATETPVQPIALRYLDATSPISAAAAYVGDTTLLQSLWKVATASGLCVSVKVLPREGTRHLDRRALTEKVRGEIEGALA